MNIKEKTLLIIGIIIVIGSFYWFQIRPGEIRKRCETIATNNNTKSRVAINNYFRQCLVKNGMSPESLFVNLK